MSNIMIKGCLTCKKHKECKISKGKFWICDNYEVEDWLRF